MDALFSAMKKITYFIIGCSLLFNSACRLDKLDVDCLEHVTFNKTYSNAHYFTPHDIKETTDGRYIICGSINYDTDEDIFLMKVDKEGEVLFFESERKTSTSEVCSSIIVTKDRGFLVCGKAESKAYFAKYNFEGKLLDDTRVELFDASECSCMNKSGEYEYVFGGRAANPEVSNSYVGTLSLQGQKPTIITHYLPNPRDNGENVLSVIPSKEGYVAVGHSYNSPQTGIGTAVHFYRLDNNLQRVPNTEKFYHFGTQQDIASTVLEKPDGNYIVTGKLHAPEEGNNIFVANVNPNGEVLQRYEYGGNRNDQGEHMIYAHEAGEYVVAGFSSSLSSDGSDDMYVAKIKENGTIVWERTFGQTGIDERAHAIIPTECGGYVLTGFAHKNDGTRDVQIIKINANGNVE